MESDDTWTRKLENLTRSSSRLYIPNGIRAKVIYEDLERRIAKKPWTRDPITTLAREWLASKNSDNKTMGRLASYMTGSQESAVEQFLLRTQAERNYTSLLPKLTKYPDPSLTRLLIKSVAADLDAKLPKPIISFTEDCNSHPDKRAVLIYEPSSSDSTPLEYYDMHKLTGASGNKPLGPREVHVFKNLVRTSSSQYEEGLFVENHDSYIAPVNYVVMSRIPTGSKYKVLEKLYCAFVACRRVGIEDIMLYNEFLKKDDPTLEITMLGLAIIAAWLTGIKTILLEKHYASEGYTRDSNTILQYAVTPREHINRYPRMQYLFDHKLAILDTLIIRKRDFVVPHGTDVEKLHGDMDTLGEDAIAKNSLAQVLAGKKLSIDEANELFALAAEKGCDTVMFVLYTQGYIDADAVVAF